MSLLPLPSFPILFHPLNQQPAVQKHTMLVQVADGTSTHNELIRESYYQKTNPIKIYKREERSSQHKGDRAMNNRRGSYSFGSG